MKYSMQTVARKVDFAFFDRAAWMREAMLVLLSDRLRQDDMLPQGVWAATV